LNDKATDIVNYVESLLTKTDSVSSGDKQYNVVSASVAPVVAVMPTNNDKGKVTVEEFSSSVDIKDLADLEYFKQKQFAALRMPPAIFGMESVPGIGSSGSLAKMDIKYARAVKKVQRVIVRGVTDIIDRYNELYGKTPTYSVKIIKVSSSEDIERYEEISARVQAVSAVFDGISDSEGKLDKSKLDMMRKFFKYVIPIPSMTTYLNAIVNKEETPSPEPKEPEEAE